MNVRLGFKEKDKKTGFVHMLNGTLCATERALCCLVENYQTPEVIFTFQKKKIGLRLTIVEFILGSPYTRGSPALHAGPGLLALYR